MTEQQETMKQLVQQTVLTALQKEQSRKKLESANEAIGKLRPDAWVKLPLMEGTQTACKLVAVVSAADKYIFANRAGIKVGIITTS